MTHQECIASRRSRSASLSACKHADQHDEPCSVLGRAVFAQACKIYVTLMLEADKFGPHDEPSCQLTLQCGLRKFLSYSTATGMTKMHQLRLQCCQAAHDLSAACAMACAMACTIVTKHAQQQRGLLCQCIPPGSCRGRWHFPQWSHPGRPAAGLQQ